MPKRLRLLVTGGSTSVKIDQVRVISNVFHGRTASDIAYEAANRGHDVTVVGNPEMAHMVPHGIRFLKYRYFEELAELMEEELAAVAGRHQALIHSAAVSDYRVSAVLTGSREALMVVDSSGKVPGTHRRLYLELEPTEKLVDKVRRTWGFTGVLVKFKLQVGVSDEELGRVAEASRDASGADIVVANCLEWCRERAYVLPGGGCDDMGDPQPVERHQLAATLLDAVEARL